MTALYIIGCVAAYLGIGTTIAGYIDARHKNVGGDWLFITAILWPLFFLSVPFSVGAKVGRYIKNKESEKQKQLSEQEKKRIELERIEEELEEELWNEDDEEEMEEDD